jgi:hypothetical protein
MMIAIREIIANDTMAVVASSTSFGWGLTEMLLKCFSYMLIEASTLYR